MADNTKSDAKFPINSLDSIILGSVEEVFLPSIS